MDKKIKSSLMQMVSDLPNDTDRVGGKIKQIIPNTGKMSREGKEGEGWLAFLP